jgi:hypothetical protein
MANEYMKNFITFTRQRDANQNIEIPTHPVRMAPSREQTTTNGEEGEQGLLHTVGGKVDQHSNHGNQHGGSSTELSSDSAESLLGRYQKESKSAYCTDSRTQPPN